MLVYKHKEKRKPVGKSYCLSTHFKRRNAMKKMILAAAIAAMTLAAAASVNAADYTISIGHTNAENDSWHLAALEFKNYVEEKSEGRIEVEVYPNSQLGTEIEMIQSISCLRKAACNEQNTAHYFWYIVSDGFPPPDSRLGSNEYTGKRITEIIR